MRGWDEGDHSLIGFVLLVVVGKMSAMREQMSAMRWLRNVERDGTGKDADTVEHC